MADTLFQQFIAAANFQEAFAKVHAKGSAGGVDGVSLAAFARQAPFFLRRLRREVAEGSYLPQPVAGVSVPKHDEHHGRRLLGLPTVADKVVQMALYQVVMPLAERHFCDTSYGYRPNKGPYKALRRVEHNLKSGKLTWVIHRDVDDFFDTLGHDRLLTLFGELVHDDRRLLDLVALWCRSGMVGRDGHWRDLHAGVRQGQILSPLLANLYLHQLDCFVAGQGWGWVRYADDYLLQCAEKEVAVLADREVEAYLREHLGLGLNLEHRPVAHVDEGFSFLGIYFKGQQRAIDIAKVRRMKRRLDDLLAPAGRLGAAEVFARLPPMLEGWRRYYGFIRPVAQFREVQGHLETMLGRLVAARIAAGQWPSQPQPDWSLPSLLPDGERSGPGPEALAVLWRKAVAGQSRQARTRADRRVVKRRRQYRREEQRSGEIHVVTPGHFVGLRGGRIVVREKQRLVSETPGERVRGVTLAARGLALSSDVVRFCCERDVALHFTDEHGRVIGVLQRPDSRRSDIALLQVTHRDGPLGLRLAGLLVYGKVKNQFALLKYHAKYKNGRRSLFREAFAADRDFLEGVIDRIKHLKLADGPVYRQSLMGLEGAFAARYWRLVGRLLPESLQFLGRYHQGAKDVVNCSLNYGYGILYGQVHDALIRAGLNPASGFLHAEQPGKPVLAWDLIEVFRAPVVDRSLFAVFNRGAALQLEKNATLSAASRGMIAAAVLERLGCEEPGGHASQSLRNLIDAQAGALVDHLREAREFRPFLSRW